MVFVISWGHGTKQRPYGPAVAGPCPECGGDQPFRGRVTYDVRHLWHVLRWVTERRYSRQCQTCGWTERIPQKVAQKGLARPGISVFDRWGWAMGLTAFSALLTFAAMGDAADHKRYRAMVAQPAVNDLYELDLAKVLPRPQGSVMYAIVRVDQVNARQVIVQLPKGFYDGSSRELDAAIYEGGAAHRPDYFTDETLTLTRAQLVELKRSGTIWRVAR